MRPPSDEALRRAATILMESMELVNPGDENTSRKEAVRREFELLDTAAYAINNKLRVEASQYKRRYNGDFSPIHTLPAELLLDIFVSDIHFHSPTKEERRRHQITIRQHQLAQVCSSWRNLIVQAPQLWTVICYDHGDGVLALKMSKQSLLDVRFNPSTYDDEPERSGEFLRRLGPESRRWRTLNFQMSDQLIEPARTCLGNPAPHLISLSASFRRSFYSTGALALPLPDAPSLRFLGLMGAHYTFDNCHFPQLRELHLQSLVRAPSTEEICAILSEAHNLTKFTFADSPQHSFPVADRPHINLEGVQPIFLPKLSSLVLGLIPADTSEYLISAIRTSSLESISVSILHTDHFALDNGESNLFNLVRPVVRPGENITLVQDATDRCVLIKTPEATGRSSNKGKQIFLRAVTAPEVPISSAMRSAVQFLQATMPQVGKILFRAQGHRLDFDDLVDNEAPPTIDTSILDSLPSVYGICADNRPDALEVLHYLSQPTLNAEDGRLTWPCPRLESLDFQGADHIPPEALTEYENGRYGPDGGEGASGQDRPPRTRLTGPGVPGVEFLMEQVEEAVPDG